MKTYSAWNEVNHASQPTFKKPGLAVRYYDVLRKDARSRKFKVMAADILDTSNMSRYLRSFLRKAKGSPRLWGLHNYQDVNYRTSADTRRMLALVPGEVWLTETGGIAKFGRLKSQHLAPGQPHEVDVQAGQPVRLAPARAALEDHAALRLLLVR